jgi:mRNA-degrading endonuclease HigB of HigAB toxin-antitoxin module
MELDFDIYSELCQYIDNKEDLENLAMSSKIVYNVIPKHYKEVIRFINYEMERFNYYQKFLVSMEGYDFMTPDLRGFLEDKFLEWMPCHVYRCLCLEFFNHSDFDIHIDRCQIIESRFNDVDRGPKDLEYFEN